MEDRAEEQGREKPVLGARTAGSKTLNDRGWVALNPTGQGLASRQACWLGA